ncbi:cysteine desulfurase family protein [Desulforhabdus sp. TSK]|uniref:cysteine desulfurase family protein n=1 Tax=Desulforhabdus sp. TSK TaxID=2925014 RepID=UPI001FC8670E|nr:cysteine desulfurase family protein [Desulforhabdus sp. TSK]GKT08376.1 cysteine desulfurase NifS [Desulforhabdus sp. TSK]
MIYLDNNATTKPFPEVVETMTRFMTSRFWNASSAYGQVDGLEGTVESAKAAIRKLSGVGSEDEVIFTSGATESNVWAVTEGARKAAGGGWVLSSQIEHPSVRETLEHFREQGLCVRWASVTREGALDLDELKGLVDPDLRFVSLMLAHNETGIIQPVSEATALIRERSPECLIHTDATQVLGKMPISFSDDLDEVDLISLSGHKFHGPKGIGGLIVRNGVLIEPLIRGGGQQNDLRSGTMNTPAIAGIGAAANKCWELLRERQPEAVRAVRDHFEERISSVFPGALILGRLAPRLPNTSFFGIPGTDADDLVLALAAKGIAVSKGSACSAQSIEPSRTAAQMGYSYEEASSLIRFSASCETTFEEVNLLADELQGLCRHAGIAKRSE